MFLYGLTRFTLQAFVTVSGILIEFHRFTRVVLGTLSGSQHSSEVESVGA